MLRRRVAILFALAMAVGALTAVAPAAGAGAQPGPSDPRRADRAVTALKVVEELAAGRGDRADLTMALRDLALFRDALPAAEQRRAASYLARPTDSPNRCLLDVSCYRTREVQRVCSAVVCVHWVRRADDGRNGVAPADRDRDGRPNYVEKVLANVTRVHRTYVRAGYRAPLRDGRRGGNGKRDVYLAQIGNQGFYGYCTTDDRRIPRHGAASAYCVLDNDYRRREFRQHTPIQNMQVTAAHEYFHAVQFGYDIGEDNWFMEGTATWVEDEVFDHVNDNRAYLQAGPLGHPRIPLDTFQSQGVYQYGTWIFFRHVSERHRAVTGGLPTVVRRMWEYADARLASAPDLASLGAIQQALVAQGDSLARSFALMAAHNRAPGAYYAEGAAYPQAPLDDPPKPLDAGETWPRSPGLDHLSSATYRLQPGTGAGSLVITITSDAPSEVVARVVETNGSAQPLERLSGDGSMSVEFAQGTVRWVEVTIANTSPRTADDSASQTVSFEAVAP